MESSSSSSLKAADDSDNLQQLTKSGCAITDDLEFGNRRTDQLEADSIPSVRETCWYYYHEPVSYMDPKLYRSAITGKFDAFQDIESESRLCDQVTPRGNTVLHIAAASRHYQLVQFLVKRYPGLVWKENDMGDLALHVAAYGGHLPTLQSLLPATNPEGETDINCALKKMNEKGNTALHIALEYRHKEAAEFLATKDVTVSNYMNSEGKSPLCLAAEAAYSELVKPMMAKKYDWREKSPSAQRRKNKGRRKHVEKLYEGKSLVQAAIMGRNKDVLEGVLCYDEEDALIKLSLMDEEGRTALSFAAYKGYLDVVRYLLNKSTEIAYVRDKDGYFPIHMASREGHIEIVREFLLRCPDSRELLDDKRLNILHVAAMYGKDKMVTYMLKTQKLDHMLINESDYRGNTPLHLAAKNWHPKVVSILTWDKRVQLDAVNGEGMTAMDFVQNNMETMAPFRKRLTVAALKSAHAPSSELKASFKEDQKSAHAPSSELKARFEVDQKKFSTLEKTPKNDPYKDRINILLLVSTLVATVTFAAGFTMPGGNNDSGKDEGTATMVTEPVFHAFLICNTIAMYSSIIVVISLIFAQLGDLCLILTALRVALPFLGLAVVMMSSAFMAGTYLVVSNHNLLAIFFLILGSIFFIILLALFILLYSPTSSHHNYLARFVFYYPFLQDDIG